MTRTKLSDRPTPEELLNNFVDNTSAHGFRSVKDARSKLGKICWTLCILSMWVVCGYQTIQTVHRYFRWQTKVQMQIKNSKDAKYPALSICNLNPLRVSKYSDNPEVFQEIRKYILEIEQNASSLTWKQIENYTASHPNVFTTEVEVEAALHYTFYANRVDLHDLGHQIEDMLISCTFQGKYCTPLNFSFWHRPQYGNCYTIFMHDFEAYIGPDFGLSVGLFVEDFEYMSLISPSAGFRVQIHPPTYVPFPDQEGFTISPGSITSVAISETKIARLGMPFDQTDCGKNHEVMSKANLFSYWAKFYEMGKISTVNYTKTSCDSSCFLWAVYENCGCIDAGQLTWDQAARFFGVNKLPPACDKSNIEVNICIQKATNMVDAYCLCPQPCFEQSYASRVTSSYWPRPSYFATMQKTWAARVPAIAKLTSAGASYNLALLEVYFENLNFQSVVESPAMDIWELLSSFGGTLGLYVGVSFLTVLEFGELLLRFVKALFAGNEMTVKISPTSHENSVQ